MARRTAVSVGIETGAKRVFAFAVEWPGWCRAARSEDLALDALAAYAPRYAPVAALAGVAFPPGFELAVAERVPGTATTDFGAPDARVPGDSAALSVTEAARLIALMHAGWETLDGIAAHAPAQLRKGPRGCGRDRDTMLEHVLGAEQAYARKLGVPLTTPDPHDVAAVRAFRATIASALQERAALPPSHAELRSQWPVRYFVRRLTWHALDHAWEMEDRSES